MEKRRAPVPDHYTLILSVSVHVRVAVVADREYVGRQLSDFTILVQLDLLRGVDRQNLVGVHCDEDRAGVSLRKEET